MKDQSEEKKKVTKIYTMDEEGQKWLKTIFMIMQQKIT